MLNEYCDGRCIVQAYTTHHMYLYLTKTPIWKIISHQNPPPPTRTTPLLSCSVQPSFSFRSLVVDCGSRGINIASTCSTTNWNWTNLGFPGFHCDVKNARSNLSNLVGMSSLSSVVNSGKLDYFCLASSAILDRHWQDHVFRSGAWCNLFDQPHIVQSQVRLSAYMRSDLGLRGISVNW